MCTLCAMLVLKAQNQLCSESTFTDDMECSSVGVLDADKISVACPAAACVATDCCKAANMGIDAPRDGKSSVLDQGGPFPPPDLINPDPLGGSPRGIPQEDPPGGSPQGIPQRDATRVSEGFPARPPGIPPGDPPRKSPQGPPQGSPQANPPGDPPRESPRGNPPWMVSHEETQSKPSQIRSKSAPQIDPNPWKSIDGVRYVHSVRYVGTRGAKSVVQRQHLRRRQCLRFRWRT